MGAAAAADGEAVDDVPEGEVPVTLAPAPAPVAVAVGLTVIPLVNGTELLDDALEKAGTGEVAVVLGVAAVLFGLRTLQ